MSHLRRLAAGALALAAAACGGAEAPPVVLATTTSVEDSGLLDELLPAFTHESGIRVQAVAVGTGAALRMGREGDADLLLTHAPAGEQELVQEGAALERVPFMENHFVIAGPETDPAGVRGESEAAAAFARIAAAGAPFVSRGDDSGTHRRERALWRAAGLDPDPQWEGFTRTGTGMGLTLQVAAERRSYVLSDRGTFLAYRERTALVELSTPDPELRNEYSLLRVNPERFPGRIHADEARALAAFLVRPDTQRAIAGFGRERFGEPLFRPLLLEAAS